MFYFLSSLPIRINLVEIVRYVNNRIKPGGSDIVGRAESTDAVNTFLSGSSSEEKNFGFHDDAVGFPSICSRSALRLYARTYDQVSGMKLVFKKNHRVLMACKLANTFT